MVWKYVEVNDEEDWVENASLWDAATDWYRVGCGGVHFHFEGAAFQERFQPVCTGQKVASANRASS